MRLFKPCLLLIVFCLPGWRVQAQKLSEDFEPEYFPAELMRTEGVSEVAKYRCELDSGVVTVSGRTIRIAKERTQWITFNRLGLPVTRFASDLKMWKMSSDIHMTYDAEMRLTDMTYQSFFHYEFSPPDSPGTPLSASTTHYTYDGDRLQTRSSISIPDGRLLNTTVLSYDANGQLQREQEIDEPEKLVRIYRYEGSTIRIEEHKNDTLTRYNLITLDSAGRVLSDAYFYASDGEIKPGVVESYTYDANGRVEEERFEIPFEELEEGKLVLITKNRYDDHGKLIESTCELGDGRRTVEWYIYEYWDDK